jgi:hypothetical protein
MRATRSARSRRHPSTPPNPKRARFALAGALLALALAAPAEAVKRRAFVTSVSGTANLASWPDAGGATGLAAGNAICRARAQAAGLPNATTYRAWLSTETTDAYCHVRGQSGKKGTCTGGSPLGAGPWYLVNGVTNFTGTLDQLTSSDPTIYRPVLRDEFNSALPLDGDARSYWTGTSPDGKVFDDAPGFTCGNWTHGASGSTVVGDSYATVWNWTQGGYAPPCSAQRRLLCFEPGTSETATLGWSPGNLVFVTSAAGNGDLSGWPQAGAATGLAAGDAICRNLATAAHLPDPGSFVAWLSTPSVDARDRVTANGPFRRLDAYIVANDEADLLDGSLDTTIHVNEAGVALYGAPQILTGTLDDGTASGLDCAGWTVGDSSEDSTYGRPNLAGLPDWTDWTSNSCTGSYRLYCFSNRTVLFWDGFDRTGDLSRWSSATP